MTSSATLSSPVSARTTRRNRGGRSFAALAPGGRIALGVATLWLSLLVLLPLAALLGRAAGLGWAGFWQAIQAPEAAAALRLTITQAIGVTLVDVVMGTLIAWVLVRDRFPGSSVLDVVVDVPFALPTIVAGLVLLALYGPGSPVGVDVSNSRPGVFLALLFVTLPFVVRTVGPVLAQLDRDVEEAARSLGASRTTTFRRIILPHLVPAIASGAALSFARALSEYGAIVLISGNIPLHTQVASVQIAGQIENDNTAAASAVATVLLGVTVVVLVGLSLVPRLVARRRG